MQTATLVAHLSDGTSLEIPLKVLEQILAG
jgi:hypothetical protein